MKKICSVLLCIALAATLFAGCSNAKKEKYTDTVLIVGYTQAVAPILEVDKDGKATGFDAELFEKIFDAVKGELKSYTFEQVEEGYTLEKSGGFTDSKGKEYSAGLLMGVATKNQGTFNEDYSFTDPIITNRVVGVTKKGSERSGWAHLKDAKVLTVSEAAATAFAENRAISSVCKSVTAAKDINAALAALDSGNADVVVTDEFSLMPTKKADSYQVFEKELDKIEYVIACAKYSGWKDSLNEAIFELKSEEHGKGDEFTPMVEQYFGYNASSFKWQPEKTK